MVYSIYWETFLVIFLNEININQMKFFDNINVHFYIIGGDYLSMVIFNSMCVGIADKVALKNINIYGLLKFDFDGNKIFIPNLINTSSPDIQIGFPNGFVFIFIFIFSMFYNLFLHL